MRMALCCLAAAVSVSACVSVTGEKALTSGADAEPGLEGFYYAATTANGVRVRVPSQGCTTAASFDVNATPTRAANGETSYRLAFVRKERDGCGVYTPSGENLTYAWADLGLPEGASVTLANPVMR